MGGGGGLWKQKKNILQFSIFKSSCLSWSFYLMISRKRYIICWYDAPFSRRRVSTPSLSRRINKKVVHAMCVPDANIEPKNLSTFHEERMWNTYRNVYVMLVVVYTRTHVHTSFSWWCVQSTRDIKKDLKTRRNKNACGLLRKHENCCNFCFFKTYTSFNHFILNYILLTIWDRLTPLLI